MNIFKIAALVSVLFWGGLQDRAFALSVDATSFDPTTVTLAPQGGPMIGSLVMWSTGTVPSDYFECNGASLSQATYADLFAAIGCTYGCPGSNFHLPDWRGYFPRAWSHGSGRDPMDAGGRTGGDTVGSTQDSAIMDHSHGLKYGYYPAGGGGYGVMSENNSGDPENWTDPLSRWQFSNVSGAETRPKNMAVMFIIKWR